MCESEFQTINSHSIEILPHSCKKNDHPCGRSYYAIKFYNFLIVSVLNYCNVLFSPYPSTKLTAKEVGENIEELAPVFYEISASVDCCIKMLLHFSCLSDVVVVMVCVGST